MRTQSKYMETASRAGKREWTNRDGWLVEFFRPITERSKATPTQSRITFDTQLKIALLAIVLFIDYDLFSIKARSNDYVKLLIRPS